MNTIENTVIPIEEFTNLMENGLVAISKIEWWLLKYSDFYTDTYNYVHSHNLIELKDGRKVYLPPNNPTDKEKFINLYESLDTISELHRNEKYFEQEIAEYTRIAHSPSDVKKWVTKNEYLGVEYVCFISNYLSHGRGDHLNVYVHYLKEVEINIDRQNFMHSIDFIEKFNKLYSKNKEVSERD